MNENDASATDEPEDADHADRVGDRGEQSEESLGQQGSDEQRTGTPDGGASDAPQDEQGRGTLATGRKAGDDIDDDTDEPASDGLFDELLAGERIFEDKEVLRPSYTPNRLPHRGTQINDIATVLVSALRGDTPSNILVYGKTGTGKTASAKYVSQELERSASEYEVDCEVEYINCEVTDTQYRVLAQLGNEFIEDNLERAEDDISELTAIVDAVNVERANELGYEDLAAVRDRIEELRAYTETTEEIPMTGWPTDRVYQSFFEAIDLYERVLVFMFDEIDKLVEKSGDDTLYNLSRINSGLERSKVSIIGISNDLKFTDFLDPRVKSSLGEEEIVFPPYDAQQISDILDQRAEIAFSEDVIEQDVIPLCAAFAAQEHGDARRALDLLRCAGEFAERDGEDRVGDEHVRRAQDKIELDRIVEAVRTLPTQSKLVLLSIIDLDENGESRVTTGEVYNVYRTLAEEAGLDPLTQRRATDLISELDMLGIVNAVVVSKGRYGRTKEISVSVPTDRTREVIEQDARLGEDE
ncbi:DNA replication protein Orc7 [Salinarchaeum chitinilyticum]